MSTIVLTNSPVTVYFYQIGYSLTFLLGFPGNTASLLTFSRTTLRKVSTGCLFMALAISDFIYLAVSLFDYLEFGFKVELYGHVPYPELCRFRAFMMNLSQFVSAWILAIIAMDRWIRTRFPFRSVTICTRKYVLTAVAVVVLLGIGLHGHFFVPPFGRLKPGFANGACGPNFIDVQYTNFYFYQWSMIQIGISCLIPAFVIILAVSDFFLVVRLRKRAVRQMRQAWENYGQRQKPLQNQMLIIILASVAVFIMTTLPLAIGKIIFPQHQNLQAVAVRMSTIWTGLGWFQSLNYAVNFYIHCLTSRLFRNEFKQHLRCLMRQSTSPVRGIDATNTKHGPRTIGK